MVQQTEYSNRIPDGQPGQLARPVDYLVEHGFAQVGTGERKPRPGDAVIWDSTNNRWKCPDTTDAELVQTAGIVLFERNKVARGTETQVVEIEDGMPISVITRGFVWVRVATTAAIPYRSAMKWIQGASVTAESDWEAWTGSEATRGTTIAALNTYFSVQNPVLLWEFGGVEANTDAVAMVRIGHGRV